MTDNLGPDFDLRLRASLDRVDGPTPLPENARFSSMKTSRRLGPLRPALALAGALGILMVAATALAGSPNPGVWQQRAVNSIESVTHSQSSPSPESEGSHHAPVQPSTRTEPSETSHESPEPSSGSHQEPSPSPDGHDSSNPAPSPTPSPGSQDGGHESPAPSPSPSGTNS
jgi:hypothetical protein